MSVSEAFQEQIRELLHGLGHIQFRRMFGGVGVYRDGTIFGLGDDDVLYLKVDELSEAEFRGAGSEPFVYERDGKAMPMSYWRLPDSALDDPDEAVHWARLAVEASHRAAAKKPKAKKKS